MSNVIIFTAIIGLLLLAVFIILNNQTNTIANVTGLTKSTNKQPTYIITGLSNSGKTLLYNKIVGNDISSSLGTVTSQEPNFTTELALPSTAPTSTKFKLIEFPGHQKLQNLTINEIKNSSKVHGLIYLIDSSIDPKKINENAKFLYDILSITERRPGGIDILIGCNKSDLFSARQPLKIRELLEKEIDSLRKLNVSNISKIDNNDMEEEFNDLGQSIEMEFKFEKLEGNFDVINGSVLKNQIDKWECWIDERAVNF
ncbi:Translation initiation factor IF-2 [Wickerhamomyces ciferrii]|uniref:Signal recognition particle receptor subunit beta n=1 Tax=Wickerhamomyces ciferrii (strain ATCC 14091 / BCRC 22168 / CBS 111 / JCM 3599 / NBRC 0793 / NRRL Y-1031 F-60-10) TaxID=1206466 RepID=K0KPM8_WICCF|nr:Translation initiation factor IF-2 [Wickerhamomyces ciferrii]CCH43118.1 Translation initiation factor IF-2 [Wickerhamomyces ciferrii]